MKQGAKMVFGSRFEDQEGFDQYLAYLLVNTPESDPRLQDILIQRFGADVIQLCNALLDKNWRSPPSPSLVERFAVQVFSTAIQTRHEIAHEESIRLWLFSIVIKLQPEYAGRAEEWMLEQNSKATYGVYTASEFHYERGLYDRWTHFDRLEENLRRLIILHLVMDIVVDEMAHLLNEPSDHIDDQLRAAWSKLFSRDQDTVSLTNSQGENTHTLDLLIQPIVDQSERHIASCEICNRWSNHNRLSYSSLYLAINWRWPSTNIDPNTIAGEVHVGNKKSGSFFTIGKSHAHIRELVLLSVTIFVVLSGAYFLGRIDRPISSDTLNSGEIINAIPLHDSYAEQEIFADPSLERDIRSSSISFIEEPSISLNGEWIAFTSSIPNLVGEDKNNVADVFIMNLHSREIQRVSVSSEGEEGDLASGWPSISGDGRLVAFSSFAQNLVYAQKGTCNLPNTNTPCSDVYVHDRTTQETRVISSLHEDKGNRGHSKFPSISADGGTVVFWSGATDLTSGDDVACIDRIGDPNFLDIYIKELQEGTIECLSVGHNRDQPILEPISITADGSMISFTVRAFDRLGGEIGVVTQSEAVVYHRDDGTFQQLNISELGVAGNGASYNSRLSADGRNAIFVSQASNLVTGDHNNREDIYLRDLPDNSIVRLSSTESGESGNGESGTFTVPGLISWGEQIDISGDGRYAVYLSHADDLLPELINDCGHPGKTICRNVILQDIGKDEKRVVLAGPARDSFYLDVQISEDGRWIVVVEKYLRCNVTEVCTELWVYDRLHDSLTNPIVDLASNLVVEDVRFPYLSIPIGSVVNAVAYSSEGNLLALGTGDGWVQIRKDDDGALLQSIEAHTLPVTSIDFVEEAGLLISGSMDGRVKVWRLSDGALLSEILSMHGPILDLKVDGSGDLLAVGGKGQVWLYLIEGSNFHLVNQIYIPHELVNSVAFSPDGVLLAMAVDDGTIWLTKSREPGVPLRLSGHQDRVLAVDFSPDGSHLISGAADNLLNIWSVENVSDNLIDTQLLLSIEHPDWVYDISFSPSSDMIAAATLDYRLWLFGPGGSQDSFPELKLRHDELISLDFSPNEDIVAGGTVGGGLYFWKIR